MTRRDRVQVFTAEGKFLRMFGSRGQGLNTPVSICAANGMVCVGEFWNPVSVFNSSGQFLRSYGPSRVEPDIVPYAMAFDNDNKVLYVCDHKNNCVEVIKI